MRFYLETKYKRIESISEQSVSAEMSFSGQASAGMGSWKEKILLLLLLMLWGQIQSEAVTLV